MKLIQIGVGIRGGHWLDIVRKYPGAVGVAFVDPNPAALARARQAAGDAARYFSDLKTALAEVEADAALVVSPSARHAEHTLQALEAGLAVMVEKPFALTVAEADRVLRQAQAAGKPVVVAENYRFWPAERTVRQLIRDGRIGPIDGATLVDRRHMPSATEGPWLAATEFPQLQEIAIHHFDSLRSFFGRPTAVTVHAWNPPWSDYQHHANTQALLDFGGVRVTYLGTLLSHRFSFSLWIEGERGVIWTNRKHVLWRPAGARLFRWVRPVKVPPGEAASYPVGGTTSLLNSLREAVERGAVAETDGRDSIWNVAMVEAGKRSHHERRAVAVAEVYQGPDMASR